MMIKSIFICVCMIVFGACKARCRGFVIRDGNKIKDEIIAVEIIFVYDNYRIWKVEWSRITNPRHRGIGVRAVAYTVLTDFSFKNKRSYPIT